jgi:hypothetical protein
MVNLFILTIFILNSLSESVKNKQKLVVGQFPVHGKGAEGGLFLLAFQKGDFIHRSGIVRGTFH